MIVVENKCSCTTVWFGIGKSCISLKLSEKKSEWGMVLLLALIPSVLGKAIEP